MAIPFNFINIGVWNIHGLFTKINEYKLNKLDDPSFRERLNTFEIFCLQEIQYGPQDLNSLSVQGYRMFPFYRKISSNSRYYGGSLIFVRNILREGIKIIENLDGDKIWLKLKKEFFRLKKDLYISFTYASPSTSEYAKKLDYNIFQKLEEEIPRYHAHGNVLLAGDFNAKTGIHSDYVTDQMDDHSPVNLIENYHFDKPVQRNNSDKHPIDKQGEMLLNLCKSNRIRILNGCLLYTSDAADE